MSSVHRLPPAHPFNPLSALRLIVAAGSDHRVVETVFDAVFKYGRDVADVSVIEDLARGLGIADIDAALNDPKVKRRLHDNTDWAIAHGVFGVPTFVIGVETFWGHDSLEIVLDYLQDSTKFADPEMRRIEQLPVGVTRPRKQWIVAPSHFNRRARLPALPGKLPAKFRQLAFPQKAVL